MTPPNKKPNAPQEPGKHHWLRYIFSFVLLVLVIWGGFRACSDAGLISEKAPFVIAQQRIMNTINLAGKERNAEAFFKDLIYKIAENEGLKIRLITVSPDLAFLGLENDDYDAIVTTLTPNANNMHHYDFSEPLYRIGAVLIVRKDSDVHSLKEMDGRVIGIPREASTFFDIGFYPNLIFYGYADDIDALEDLERRQLDGVIMNAWQAYVLTQGLFKGKLRVATDPFTDDGIRIASLKDSRFSRNLALFDRGLEKVRRDGTFQDLLNKWGLVSTDIWEGDHQPAPGEPVILK